ncbi:hypothetical protein CISIN_1g034776mg [Citrus sinensis]|uniref:Uncharacterized protein n=1 Tax=Citrus sinensis TaxID=2711 RepID=A0A067EGS1_CITSI|nr:hypothetical protein CISIN_1g034776mg [Citrus sinensis]
MDRCQFVNIIHLRPYNPHIEKFTYTSQFFLLSSNAKKLQGHMQKYLVLLNINLNMNSSWCWINDNEDYIIKNHNSSLVSISRAI